jgi:hypothetical protein
MKEENVTSQPQTPSGSDPYENMGDNTAKQVPLDRSSAEWRSQFGVLPSARQQYAGTRPASEQSHRATRSGVAAETSRKNNPVSFIAAIAGIVLVGGLIAYGYRPSQQAGGQKKVERPVSASPKGTVASGGSGAAVKKRPSKTAAVPSPVVAPAAVRRAAIAPAPVVEPSVKASVKTVVESVPKPRRTTRVVSGPQVATVRPPETRKQVAATPRPRRESPKTPPVLKSPTPAAPVATPSVTATAAAATPRPERTPIPTPSVPKAVVRPPRKPVTEQPTAPRPSLPNSDPDGTNPLGLPQ